MTWSLHERETLELGGPVAIADTVPELEHFIKEI